MKASDIAMDLRVWIGLSIAASLLIPELDLPASVLIIIVLMVQMTLSVDGLKISASALRENRKGAVMSVLLCYAVNTLITLGAGLLFMGEHRDIWYGWVMLASMPCAIAVVTAAVLLRESIETAVTAVTATYLSGIVLTPVLSFLLIGDAVNPFEILKYILLFIFIPVLISRPLGHLHLSRKAKVPVINMTMALMVFLSVNSNSDFIRSSPELMLTVLAFSLTRLILLNAAMYSIMHLWNPGEGRRGTFLVLGVWKNTGLSVSMSMLLLSTATSAIPCFTSMIVETIWFSIVTRSRKGAGQENINNPDADINHV